MPLAGPLIRHSRLWNSQGSHFIREHRSFRRLPVLRSTVRMWLMPLEIRMRKVPDFLSWQRFLRRQRLLFSWNTEPQRIPGDSLSERSREPGIRKNFWYTLSKIRRVSEISAISNSVMYAVRERHIHSRSISRRWMWSCRFTTDWSILMLCFPELKRQRFHIVWSS